MRRLRITGLLLALALLGAACAPTPGSTDVDVEWGDDLITITWDVGNEPQLNDGTPAVVEILLVPVKQSEDGWLPSYRVALIGREDLRTSSRPAAGSIEFRQAHGLFDDRAMLQSILDEGPPS